MSRILLPLRFSFLAALSLMAACSQIPKEAYFARGTPESLLDASSEVINIRLESARSVNDVSDWINKDQPTRAELYCLESDRICSNARGVLEQFGVPVNFVAAADNRVTLVYERVLARDCENRYIDNSINPYNLNHPTFGCSVASNIVQHVSDKAQFTAPALMDYPDAEKAVQAYGRYLEPPQTTQVTGSGTSLLDNVQGGR